MPHSAKVVKRKSENTRACYGPTWTMICSGDPRLLPTSRTRTVILVSPDGNAVPKLNLELQNCVVGSPEGFASWSPPFPFLVHGTSVENVAKRHARSSSALVVLGVGGGPSGPKFGGSIAGTPSTLGNVQTTVGSPLPRLCETSTCKSGRPSGRFDGVGSGGLVSLVPTAGPPVSGLTSTTIKNTPLGWKKTRNPDSGSKAGVGVGVSILQMHPGSQPGIRQPWLSAIPRNVITGPLSSEGVRVGVRVGVTVRVGEMVRVSVTVALGV